ncbi:MAG: GNAT family N-acetyltransferase [Pseudomonadota bacterium]
MISESEVNFREATESDLPAVLALIGQPDMDHGEVLSLAPARDIFLRMKHYPDYHIHVAERDGAVVGTFALLIMDNLGHMGAPSAIVEQVLVAPVAQGCGVGAAMMRHAMQLAAERGCYKLVLSSNLKRERAHAFYDRLGFERHGISFRVALVEACRE